MYTLNRAKREREDNLLCLFLIIYWKIRISRQQTMSLLFEKAPELTSRRDISWERKNPLKDIFTRAVGTMPWCIPTRNTKFVPDLRNPIMRELAKRARGGGGNSSSSSNSSSISSRNHYETDRPPSTSRRRAWISNGQSPADPQTVQSPGIF